MGLIGVLPATPKDADLAKWLGVKHPSLLGIGWPCASLEDIGLLDLLSSVILTMKVWAISLRISRNLVIVMGNYVFILGCIFVDVT